MCRRRWVWPWLQQTYFEFSGRVHHTCCALPESQVVSFLGDEIIAICMVLVIMFDWADCAAFDAHNTTKHRQSRINPAQYNNNYIIIYIMRFCGKGSIVVIEQLHTCNLDLWLLVRNFCLRRCVRRITLWCSMRSANTTQRSVLESAVVCLYYVCLNVALDLVCYLLGLY